MNKANAIEQLAVIEKEAAKLRRIIEDKSKVTDRLKTFADVCEELSIDPLKAFPYPDPQNDEQAGINAFAKVQLIVKALNEGWKPNWDNSSEYKYYPWFDMRKAAGSGFSCSDCADSCTGTCVGSRLCFKTSEMVLFAIDQPEIKQLYQDYLLM